MSIFGSLGAVRGQGRAQIAATGDGIYTVVVPLSFERGTLEPRIRVNVAGRITGFSFLPTQTAARWEPPAYADTTAFLEQQVQIRTPGEEPLSGILALPRGNAPFPAVLLLHGAGPGNRDAGVGATLPFRDLAYGLASRGIAVLRYDKRSFAQPHRFAGRVYTVEEEILADARAALALLRSVPNVNPAGIFLLGHSMGGMLAPRIAERDTRVAGIILLAAPSRPLPGVIGEQVDYLAKLGQMSPAENKATRSSLVAIDALPSSAAADTTRVLGAPAAYWLDLRRYDQTAVARRLAKPTLLLWGARDFQVTAADFAGWERALSGRADVTFKQYSKLNHLFIEGEGPSTFAEYQKPGHISEAVIADISAWIRARR